MEILELVWPKAEDKFNRAVRDGVHPSARQATCSAVEYNNTYLHSTSRFSDTVMYSPQGTDPFAVTPEVESVAAAISTNVLVKAVRNALSSRKDSGYSEVMDKARDLLQHPLKRIRVRAHSPMYEVQAPYAMRACGEDAT